MKPFDPTKPYCRRDGKPAKIVHTFKSGRHVIVDDVSELFHTISPNGHYLLNNVAHPLDLINIPEKEENK